MNEQLTEAAGKGDVEQIISLLEQKADINAVDMESWTPLHTAVYFKESEIVKLLIDKGANIEADDWYYNKPIHLASYYGLFEIVKLLIDQGANINAICHDNGTPIHRAAEGGYLSIVEYLIDLGANRSILNSKNKTAADLANTPELKQLIQTRPVKFWDPADHSWRANKFQRDQIKTLLLIRDNELKYNSIPNEIMFMLFRDLV